MATDWKVFIHLSDIHFNKSSGGTYDPDEDLRNELTLDSKNVYQALGGPDAILITGDIAFSGAQKEYDTAKEWLYGYVRELDRSLANVFCTPGNHDVDHLCGTIKSSLFKNRRIGLREVDMQNLEMEFNSYMSDSFAEDYIFESINEYNRFASAFKCNISSENPISLNKLQLNDGSELLMHSLNSVIISDDLDNHYERVILGRFQVPKRIPGVTNLVMCHHPPDWWRDRDSIESSLDARSSIQLFGHKHNQRLVQINNTLRMTAGAVHPSRLESDWNPRYNWFRVSVNTENDERKLIVEVYPRVWNDSESTFIPDYNLCKGAEFQKFELALDPWVPPKPQDGTIDIGLDKEDTYQNHNYPELPQFGNMDPSRILTYRFFDLSHVTRIRIANELELYQDEDEGLKDFELFERIFDRACSKNVLNSLWDKVEESHGDHKYPKNPFKK